MSTSRAMPTRHATAMPTRHATATGAAGKQAPRTILSERPAALKRRPVPILPSVSPSRRNSALGRHNGNGEIEGRAVGSLAAAPCAGLTRPAGWHWWDGPAGRRGSPAVCAGKLSLFYRAINRREDQLTAPMITGFCS